MGIQGLTGYLSTRDYFIPYKLTSSYVIIDGGSYLSIYYKSNDDPRFGGDCKKMYDITHRYFKRFLDCNVIPIVVMGGIPNKKPDVKKRSKEDRAIADFKKYNSNGYSHSEHSSLSVIFRATSFYEALSDLNVFYCRADFDADSDIVELARKLKCPVVSNDSDFFIHDGVDFLPWDFVEINKNPNLDYVECLKFDRDRLCEDFGISPLHLAYLAVLFESDYCRRNLYKVVVPKCNRKSRDKMSKGLTWLGKGSVESTKVQILKAVPKSKKEALAAEIEAVLKTYTESSTTLASVLQKRFCFKDVEFNVRDEDLIKKHSIPSDLMDLARTCKLPLILLEMLIHNSYNLAIRTTLEDVNQPSVYAPSIPLIQGIYGLFLQNEEEKPPLKIIIREGSEIISLLKPANPIPNCFLTVQNKRNLLLQCLNLSPSNYDTILKFFDEGWVLFIFSLTYFVRECQTRVNETQIRSIILTAITLQILDFYEGDDVTEPSDTVETLNDHFKNLVKEDLKHIVRKSIMLNIRKSDHHTLYNISSIHMYVTFQSCLIYTKHIFKLLRLPYEMKVSKFVSGSMCYSFWHCMTGSLNQERWITNWFGDNKQARGLFDAILENLLLIEY